MSDPRFGRDDEPMPAWRGRSTLVVSLGVHAAAVVMWWMIAAMPPVVTVLVVAPMREVARIELPPRDEPFAIDAPIPPEQLSGYDISGLPFNLPKIAARRDSLFPFLTADLTFIDRLAGDVRAAAAHLPNPLDRSLAAKPLELDDRMLQHVVDESWSRRDRWRRFQQVAALLIGHDGHDGRAPALVRGYLDQNLLQPYCDGRIKDGQFWAMVENAADHADFLEFIRKYARTRSSSRTTTELLFLMDELAQGSREVAVTVMTTNIGRDLLYTAVQSPRAALLAAELQNDLNRWFAARGTSVRADLRDAYDRVRLRILATIVETSPGGYRVSDARFLAGEIFYRQGDTDQALDWWEEMSPVPGDTYRGAATAIVDSITGAGPIDHVGLRRIIGAESARWREQNYARLRQFGYRCDSY